MTTNSKSAAAAPGRPWPSPLLDRLAVASDDLDHYLRAGGFAGLTRAHVLGPAGVITCLRDAGLRGRGPGAQPVYARWWELRRAAGPSSVLVVEGRMADPHDLGSRRLMDEDPHGLVEALACAALATGASLVRLRLGPELESEAVRLRDALSEARGAGLLEGLDLALESELAPPTMSRPLELVHTPATWYQVGLALALGPEAYRDLGRHGQSGTRVLNLVGVARPGLMEVPAGAELGEVLDAAGGPANAAFARGLALGGGSAGLLALESAAGLALAPEELMERGLGAAVNSLSVLGLSDCAVDLTRRAMTRIINQGLEADDDSRSLALHAVRLITQVAFRQAGGDWLQHLTELAHQLRRRGALTAWPLGSSLEQFSEEWVEHLAGRSCAAYDCILPTGAPCGSGCPAEIDIPGFMAHVAAGRHAEAVALIRRENPLPYICGLVCPAPCESACLRATLDQSVGIRVMKAVAARHCLEKEGGYPRPDTASPSGFKVAVVGSGPAGLAAAYYLALNGHAVTIFEAADQAGGTMYSGIPAYRLPREVIQAEVEAILELGVELKLGQALGRDITLAGLREAGYDAVFLGIGARGGYRLGIPGEADLPGAVLDGVSFLDRVAAGDQTPPASDVVVVGGGNAAMDAARTCIRLGCDSVTVAYRRTRAEMPAHEHEVEEALAEGVRFKFLTIPVGLESQDGRLTGLVCQEARLGPADASGRRRPVPVEGSRLVLPAGAVIAAIGQAPELECLGELAGDERVCDRRLKADAATGQTGVEWLFAGGDAATGPATVVEAVAAGKRAARAMDLLLKEQPPELALAIPRLASRIPAQPAPVELRSAPRNPTLPERPADQRRGDFQAVELPLSQEEAQAIAARCLRCDLCLGCGLCATACAEVGVGALGFHEAGDRLVFADFATPASLCQGCGACGNACPTGALQVVDQGLERRIVMSGTVLGTSRLVPCSVCGRPYASRSHLEAVSRRLGERLQERLTDPVCPSCTRSRQAREKWARRFLARAEHGATASLIPPGGGRS